MIEYKPDLENMVEGLEYTLQAWVLTLLKPKPDLE